MDFFNVIFHPFFFIPLFLILGVIAIVGSVAAKTPKTRRLLTLLIVIGVSIFFLPYIYAVAMWLAVNKFHWIR